MRAIITPETALADLLTDYRATGHAGIIIGGVQLTLTQVHTPLFGEPTGETELRGQGMKYQELACSEMRRYARLLGLVDCTTPQWDAVDKYWTMRGHLLDIT